MPQARKEKNPQVRKARDCLRWRWKKISSAELLRDDDDGDDDEDNDGGDNDNNDDKRSNINSDGEDEASAEQEGSKEDDDLGDEAKNPPADEGALWPSWTAKEDKELVSGVKQHGEGKWRAIFDGSSVLQRFFSTDRGACFAFLFVGSDLWASSLLMYRIALLSLLLLCCCR